MDAEILSFRDPRGESHVPPLDPEQQFFSPEPIQNHIDPQTWSQFSHYMKGLAVLEFELVP